LVLVLLGLPGPVLWALSASQQQPTTLRVGDGGVGSSIAGLAGFGWPLLVRPLAQTYLAAWTAGAVLLVAALVLKVAGGIRAIHRARRVPPPAAEPVVTG